MDIDRHIIHKVSVEVSARTSMDTNVLQEKIKTLIYEQILNKIEQYFQGTAAEIGLDTLRINRLELNLSIDALDGISTNLDIRAQVDRQLSNFFRSLPVPPASLRSKNVRSTARKESILMQGSKSLDVQRSGYASEEMRIEIQKKSPKARKIETLLHFLKTGTSPWWIKDSLEMHSILHEEVLLELLEEDPHFSQELRTLLKEPSVLFRLTSQYPPLTIAQTLIFLQHNQWPELARFQQIFLPPLLEILNLPRNLRLSFWQTFVRALRVQRFTGWKEKVLQEASLVFTTNEPFLEVKELFDPQNRKHTQLHSAEIVFLLLAMAEFNSKKFATLQEYTRTVTPTLSKEALLYYVNPAFSKSKGKLKNSNQGSEPEALNSTSMKATNSVELTSDQNNLSPDTPPSSSAKKESKSIPSDEENPSSQHVDQADKSSQKSIDQNLENRFNELRKRHDKENEKRIRKLTNNTLDEDPESSEGLASAWEDEAYSSSDESSNSAQIDPEKGFIANHAGLLLLHPFMKAFCEKWELLNEDMTLKDPDKMTHILHFMATGQEQNSEFELTFEKFLCGLNEQHVVDRNQCISEEMKDGIEELLKAVLTYWDALKSTSTTLLRNEFLKRPARIVAKDKEIRFTFERKSIDLLVDRIPWTIGFLKLPWRKEMMHIEW